MRRAVAARGAGRQVAPRASRRPSRRAATQRCGVALGAAAVEALGGQQRRPVGGHRRGGGDDRGVRHDPARASRRAARRSRRGSPTGRAAAPSDAAPAHPVHARTYAATPRPAPPARSRAGGRTPAAPTRPCRSSIQLGGQRVAQLDEHLDVEGGVLQPRLGQRPGRPVDGGVLLGMPVAEHRLHQGGQPDPRVAEQPAGELGVEQRGRAQADLGAGRAGPGWRRAGSTRCPPSASCSGARSSKAIGSTSQVPAPSRRSWIR